MAKEGARVVVNAVHHETSDAVRNEIESDGGGKALSVRLLEHEEDLGGLDLHELRGVHDG